jgi:hypothetical protein
MAAAASEAFSEGLREAQPVKTDGTARALPPTTAEVFRNSRRVIALSGGVFILHNY